MICSGTGGKITREDVLLAGAIAARLTLTVCRRAQRSGCHRARLPGCKRSSDPAPSGRLVEALARRCRDARGPQSRSGWAWTRDIDDAAGDRPLRDRAAAGSSYRQDWHAAIGRSPRDAACPGRGPWPRCINRWLTWLTRLVLQLCGCLDHPFFADSMLLVADYADSPASRAPAR